MCLFVAGHLYRVVSRDNTTQCRSLARSPCVLFVGTELDVLEETSVQMVAPQVVDELGVPWRGASLR